jgi:Asp-tRNA(Asn)/Glu-tRNA(Gln) amidotransferase A subunit family amidase
MRSSLRTANQLAAARPMGSPASPFSYICPVEGIRASTERLRDGMYNTCQRIKSEHADASVWCPSEKLKGKRVAVKDNFLVRGTPTTCSSRMLQGEPDRDVIASSSALNVQKYAIDFDSPYTATSVQHLLASGAVITAKTQMDEFGMGNMTTNLPPGSPTVHNPWKPQGIELETEEEPRSAGGSSGGSAAAVKAGLAWA